MNKLTEGWGKPVFFDTKIAGRCRSKLDFKKCEVVSIIREKKVTDSNLILLLFEERTQVKSEDCGKLKIHERRRKRSNFHNRMRAPPSLATSGTAWKGKRRTIGYTFERRARTCPWATRAAEKGTLGPNNSKGKSWSA